MVEAALVLPVVLVAVFGCLEFIQVGHASAVLHMAAAAAVRAAAVGANPSVAGALAAVGLMPPRATYLGVSVGRAPLPLRRRGGFSIFTAANPPLARITVTARAVYRPPLGRFPVSLTATVVGPSEPEVPRP